MVDRSTPRTKEEARNALNFFKNVVPRPRAAALCTSIVSISRRGGEEEIGGGFPHGRLQAARESMG